MANMPSAPGAPVRKGPPPLPRPGTAPGLGEPENTGVGEPTGTGTGSAPGKPRKKKK